jgi:hypothetical protein
MGLQALLCTGVAAFAIAGMGRADAAVIVSSTATQNTASGNASSMTNVIDG